MHNFFIILMSWCIHFNYIMFVTVHILSPVLFPGQPSIREVSTTAATISLSWSVPSESVVTSYEVMWQRSSSSAGTSGEITNSSTSYTIEGLESDTLYSITVRVANAAGSTDSPLVYVTTSKEGKSAWIYCGASELFLICIKL